MHWFRDMVDHWQTLIAGGISLAAGLVAFVGALIAACWQVRAARQAAKDQVCAVQRAADQQVAAVKSQIADLQAERERTDNLRLTVVRWAVRAEARRLDKEVVRVRPLFLIGGQGLFSKEEALIESSPLLRGEREDAALLDEATFATLEEAASTLNNYNYRVETARTGAAQAALRDACHSLLEQLAGLADTLKN